MGAPEKPRAEVARRFLPAQMPRVAATLLPSAVQLVSAGLYLWVARIVLQRELAGEARRANALFAVWWVSLGLIYLVAPAYNVATRVMGHRDLALGVTVLNVLLVLLALAVWGLVYYLAYLYTGSARAFWPITAFYVLLAFTLLYLVAWMDPVGFDEGGALRFARERLAGAPAIAVSLLFSLPVLLAALAYGSLFFRVSDPAARYRIGLVAGAFLLQFGWSAVSSVLELSRRYPDSAALTLVSNGLGVVSALAILLAFRPPAAVRRRLGLVETAPA